MYNIPNIKLRNLHYRWHIIINTFIHNVIIVYLICSYIIIILTKISVESISFQIYSWINNVLVE